MKNMLCKHGMHQYCDGVVRVNIDGRYACDCECHKKKA